MSANLGNVSILAAAQKLVDKLKLIHEDPLYQSVWVLAHTHGIDYRNGPKYDAELAELEKVLNCYKPA